jgi:hypothetical protein
LVIAHGLVLTFPINQELYPNAHKFLKSTTRKPLLYGRDVELYIMRYSDIGYKRHLGEMTRTYTRRNDKHQLQAGVEKSRAREVSRRKLVY